MAQFFNEILNWLAGIVGLSVGADSWLGYIAAAGVHIGLLLNVVAVGALIFIWMERKIAGRIQDRLGPTRVGGKFGWLQTLADGVKLVAKEDVTTLSSPDYRNAVPFNCSVKAVNPSTSSTKTRTSQGSNWVPAPAIRCEVAS